MALGSSSTLISQQDSEPAIATHESPHQPGVSFSFPKWEIGKTKPVYHSCQESWFHSWSWLYDKEAEDTVLCFLCSKAVRQKKMKPGNADAAFVSSVVMFMVMLSAVF